MPLIKGFKMDDLARLNAHLRQTYIPYSFILNLIFRVNEHAYSLFVSMGCTKRYTW